MNRISGFRNENISVSFFYFGVYKFMGGGGVGF